MMDNLLALVFWTSLVLVVYSYLIYPLAIFSAARFWGLRVSRPVPQTDDQLPAVSLIVAAYNEAAVIRRRIENALACDYPADKLEILVVSDGCSDGTQEIVRRFADRVRLVELPKRSGKSTALRAGARAAGGQILVFSDASTEFDRDALRQLIGPFQDTNVGVVCGRLELTDPQSGRNVDGLYWKYETFIKQCEAQLGALVGASGAIYAVRKDCFVPPPEALVIDDFVIPMLVRLQHRCRIHFAIEATAQQVTAASMRAEFWRRVRIGAGGFQSLRLLWRLLDPRTGWIMFSFVSHKLLRWFCPFFLSLLLICNFPLLDHTLYLWTWTVQMLFYAMALAGALVPGAGVASRLMRLTTMFSTMNLALMLGFWRWLLGMQQGTWERTVREAG